MRGGDRRSLHQSTRPLPVRREKQPTLERQRAANGPSITVSGCWTQIELHTGTGRRRPGTYSRSDWRR
jgi:hypothetical protein